MLISKKILDIFIDSIIKFYLKKIDINFLEYRVKISKKFGIKNRYQINFKINKNY